MKPPLSCIYAASLLSPVPLSPAENTGVLDLQAISNVLTGSFNHHSHPAFLGCPVLQQRPAISLCTVPPSPRVLHPSTSTPTYTPMLYPSSIGWDRLAKRHTRSSGALCSRLEELRSASDWAVASGRQYRRWYGQGFSRGLSCRRVWFALGAELGRRGGTIQGKAILEYELGDIVSSTSHLRTSIK